MGNKREKDKNTGRSIQMVKYQNNRSSMDDGWLENKIRENGGEKLIKEIMQENFPELKRMYF